MTNAVVTIVLKRGEGEDLIADCTAQFDLETARQAPKQPTASLVAFPVTAFSGGGISIVSFEALVNGTRPSKMLRRWVEFPSSTPKTPVHGLLDPKAPKWPPEAEELFPIDYGQFNRLIPGTFFADAYVWTQTFAAGAHDQVKIHYVVMVHAQPLQYMKDYRHSGFRDTVPFDLMWIGSDSNKGYFLDYILRSGASWSGPIGHETVTLVFDESIAGGLEDIYTTGSDFSVSEHSVSPNAVEQYRIGITLTHGMRREGNRLIWEINNEKPTEDILIEISAPVGKKIAPSAK